jgi:hypothetical protein
MFGIKYRGFVAGGLHNDMKKRRNTAAGVK